MRGTTAFLATLIILGGGASAGAQERLPLPRDAVPPAVAPVPGPLPGSPQVLPGPGPMPPMGNYRTSAYEHWQYRSVGRDGRFHTRVLNTPEGYFYYYNGKPYPYGPPPTRWLSQYPDTIGH
jgi:hypothetical protein